MWSRIVIPEPTAKSPDPSPELCEGGAEADTASAAVAASATMTAKSFVGSPFGGFPGGVPARAQR
jgi:hypothetical protein